MTAKTVTDYKKDALTCADCISFAFLWKDLLDYNDSSINVGICRNGGSDHYAHQMDESHPACDAIMTVQDYMTEMERHNFE